MPLWALTPCVCFFQGKTLIAAVLMFNYYRWFPKGKVVFLAPTRPLVQQQAEACRVTMGIPSADMCELTGSSRKDDDGRRSSAWAAHRVFFATPQTFHNDLKGGACPAEALVALVLDEAHRATGAYAYVTSVRHLTDAGVRVRIMALSATPGTTADAVQEVLRNLHIGAVEYRSEEDADVAPYTHRRVVDVRAVQPTQVMVDVNALYMTGFRPLLGELISMGVVQGNAEDAGLMLSPYVFVRARNTLSADVPLQARLGGRIGRVHFLLNACSALSRGLDLLHSGGLRPALDYLMASKDLVANLRSPPLQEALRLMQAAATGGAAHAPKLAELAKVLRAHFTAAKDAAAFAAGGAAGGAGGAAGSDDDAGEAVSGTRAIVFTSSRESVKHVMEELSALRGFGVIASEFIGQARAAVLRVHAMRVAGFDCMPPLLHVCRVTARRVGAGASARRGRRRRSRAPSWPRSARAASTSSWPRASAKRALTSRR
jgi:Fanconi anemia group M protein